MNDYKQFFPWFKNNKDVIYLDSSATSLKPQVVIDAIVDYYTKYSTNPHNTDSNFTFHTHEIMNETRANVAKFINANFDEIIFTSGATESLNLIANGLRPHLKKGDEIILTYIEHASNLLPWYKLRDDLGVKIIFANQKNQFPQLSDFLKVISPKTKVVSFASGGNLIGNVLDENLIIKNIKKIKPDVLVCVDATQSIQHRMFDVKKCKSDFMVFSAHKLLGPTGIGVAYIKNDLIKKMQPLKYGGGMNFSIDLNSYQLYDNYMKFEGGTPHVAGFYGFNAALKFLMDIGYNKIHEHELKITKYARDQLALIPEIKTYVQDATSSTITFSYNGVFCQDFANYLGSKNIIVRSGLSCAKIINNVIQTECAIRASFYIYNDFNDVDRLIKAIKEYQKGDELNGIL
ncbi:MAG: cysteine desulfurase [Ureaplasma parvum]|uniref:Probable cysteine desulfurase n=2 Tax=Ureaplasma parvum serovar 3 TaxID=38504 RepID=CSD_UREPA|nr:cysteine desulfurase [Ureaplasma parvum]Q9PQ36.1 RecName: Full=Probable cysteine desulfurase [Ureaplasma parvum serovar 3 str. ATCC 700970]pir/D82890/ nitrogen fixation protein class-V pyridoxal-phosphate aminotransferase UU454 [imported] - Ureaplasma urealyticum [Ureaplasma urealyticum]AAF30866.1 nitrogen fixation protein - class-V pyridoxal-phosphate aminotransferase [Ureaplasma parvum serovar 3 str. ATCC 700970]ACA33095.1 aminotransferase NifS [Ureaplasma parvum serovar 3 str. ATCC 27815]